MVSIRYTDQQKLVEKSAEELKNVIKSPEWSSYVKTGISRERPPEQKDWWYLRAASILRKVSLDGPVGVSRLRSYYGGRQRRGHKPPRSKKGAGKIIRTILRDLETSGLVKTVDKPNRGRAITPKGQKFLNSIAKQIK